MASHRLFIFWTHPLFYDSVRLLLNHPDLDWVGSSSDYVHGWDQILNAPPDTILVEEEGGNLPVEIMQYIETNQWNGRIFGLNIHDNQMRMYHRVQRTVGKAEDLLEWILNS